MADDRGETLLELLIAVVIMGVAVVAVVAALVNSVQLSDVHRKQATAAAKAYQQAIADAQKNKTTPNVAPPQVNIRATYPGASAVTLENSVTQVIEQQLTGIDGLLYFSSNSSSRGQVTISATFQKGTTTVTDSALARRSASIQKRSSTKLSFVGKTVDWTT